MTVSMRWVWGTALAWTVLGLVSVAVGWGDLRETGGAVVQVWFFAAALRCVAVQARVPGGKP
jgi:hypothetical protein